MFKPHGYKTLSNSHGIEVEINDSGDGLKYKMSDSKTAYEAEIKHEADDEARAYFETHLGIKHYLDEFMKYQ